MLQRRETYASNLLVECQETTSDAHVTRDLESHAAENEHLLTGVGVECRIISLLGLPKLVFRQPGDTLTSLVLLNNTFSLIKFLAGF